MAGLAVNILSKSPSAWSALDVQRICDEAMLEGADLEFKSALPAKDGKADPWITDQSGIGDVAKDKLIREIIAFANAHGGVLVLGIQETKERPARAHSIVPLPKCAELAERLRLAVRDLIEPRLSAIAAEGVVTSNDGSGVVVFAIGPSRSAPHRNIRTRECYVRHGDRSEAMTMREIQDLTLMVDRGVASIEKQFEQARRRSAERAAKELTGDTAFMIRVTLLPLVPLRIPRVHARSDARPELRSFKVEDPKINPFTALSSQLERWRPFLGGTRAIAQSASRSLEVELGDSGLLEMIYVVQRRPNDEPVLFMSWFIALLCSAILSAHKFRSVAGSSNAEFGMEVELLVGPAWAKLIPLGDTHGYDAIGPLPPGTHLFPRYSLGGIDEVGQLVNELVRDLANIAAADFEVDLKVDFTSHLRALGLI